MSPAAIKVGPPTTFGAVTRATSVMMLATGSAGEHTFTVFTAMDWAEARKRASLVG